MSSVFATLSVLKNHVNLKVSADSVSYDNFIFKLHYRATFAILLAATVLVSSRQYFGGHINCISDHGVPTNVINTFCFFTSTFTVVKHMNASLVEEGELPHPGVGPLSKKDPITRHAYYQWVPFVLFFQALLFYIPHWIWRECEGGRLKQLLSGLQNASFFVEENKMITDNGIVVMSIPEREKKIRDIRSAFMTRLHMNRQWAYYLGMCEFGNFINIILQIFVTNTFLGGAFFNLGHNVINTDFNAAMDCLDEAFPKVTKCTFHKYGPSGLIQRHDALCVMALNIINEKIYTFLWFWFAFVAVMTALGLVWRILTMTLHARSTIFNEWVFTMACPGKFQPWNILKVTHDYYFGDWLFLYYLAKNLDNYVFKVLLSQIAEDMDEKRKTLNNSEIQPLKPKKI